VIRVLIAAASPLERAGLEALLSSSPGLQVVGRVPDGEALERAIQAQEPEVVVWATERGEEPVPTAPPGPAWILLSEEARGAWTAEALRAGARAVLPREVTSAELTAAVEAAAAGLIVLHPETAEALVPPSRPGPARERQALTPREVEVLRMLAEGLGNKEIAGRLEISEHTVKFHLGSIFAKLGATSRTEAVTLGIRLGLVLI
jgi:two-component system, NarL family, response regulator YdfI